ncbi:MAG: glycosyltransferase family 2 protein [Bacteroidota bacterium]
MEIFSNPKWIDYSQLRWDTPESVPSAVFDEINQRLDKLAGGQQPLVSVVIPAWNEGTNIVRTLYALSHSKVSFPVEIVVVNNNSTDSTGDLLAKMHVKNVFEGIAGCGPAREAGQRAASGKYILMGDADVYYPPQWIEGMTKKLQQPGVSAVYGRYSFLGTKTKHRWKLFLYESIRDLLVEIRHTNQPFMNSLGMSMGYVKEYGLKIGFVSKNIRGEDGRMCYDLMSYGKVVQLRGHRYRVWTMPRTLDKEPSLWGSLMARIAVEMARFSRNFYKLAPHDTKSSSNFDPSSLKHFKTYRDVHKGGNSKDEHIQSSGR